MTKKKVNITTSREIGKWDWLAFGIVAVFCYFTFQQGDLLHTGGSSLAYLNGHFLDFYEYNAQYFGVNNYLPSTYILFAIWNIPIKLLNLVPVPTMAVPKVVMFWYRLFPTLFFLTSGCMIYKILRELQAEERQAKLGMFLFLTAPIAVFSQFIFGQYDSMTVFFMVMGMYYWIKNDEIKFSLFFGIALTFKYTALLVFVPLLLLSEKRYLRIIRSLVIAAALFVLEVVVYIHSEAFRSGVFGFGALHYIIGISFQSSTFTIAVVIVLWLFLCGAAFFHESENRAEMYKWGIFLSSLVCFLVFGLCCWHPQWLMFMTPYIVLGMMYHRDSDAFLILDIMLMAAFTLVVVTGAPNQLDQNMIYSGVLAPLTANKDTFPVIMRDLLHAPESIYSCSAFSGLLLVMTAFKHPKYLLDGVSEKIENAVGLIRLRAFGGIAIFVAPAMICFGMLLSQPDVIKQDAGMASPLNAMTEQSDVRCYLTAGESTLTEVKVALGTYGRENQGNLMVGLYSAADDTLLSEGTADLSSFADNQYGRIDLPDAALHEGEEYYLKFVVDYADPEDVLTIYRTADNTATSTDYAVIDGQVMDYSLCVKLYGDVG